MNRRNLLKTIGLGSFGILLSDLLYSCNETADSSEHGKGKTLLVVSGWQDVNIGDIAHTPGLLNILETFLPEAKIILWKRSNATNEVKELLQNNFPKVKVIYGSVDNDKNVSSQEVLDAFSIADFLIHGSGPYVVGQSNLEAWYKLTSKPFGIFGVTIQSVSDSLKKLLMEASFIYTRETKSLEVLEKAGITEIPTAFVPDATFYMNIHDDKKAGTFMAENELEKRKYICVIPRLRYTPYHKFTNIKWTEEKIKKVEETNAKYKEQDHAKLREAMIRWVRETGNKVLVCPEMTYQVGIMDELLIDPLPADVKPFVLKRGYWLPDEAASVYKNAHTVLSFECHSPIISLHNATPAFYLRQPEDTIKGEMYYDLGYNDWVFEIMDTEGIQIADRLMEVAGDYDSALKKVSASNEQIRNTYKNAVLAI